MSYCLSLFRFLKYYARSGNAHSIHSPFVFKFYTEVIRGKAEKKMFADIEQLRHSLLNDKTELSIVDFGAGSKTGKSLNVKTISDVVSGSAMKPSWCRLLARLARSSNPHNILELGTSAGFSTMYMAGQCPEAKIISIEGDAGVFELACSNFNKLGLNNITAVHSTFDDALPDVLNKTSSVDIVVFDGNHRLEPTLKYFEMCKPYATPSSIFVFDDIYWSEEMEEAWNIISKHPDVSISIDLFRFGLIFFRKGIVKQHFSLRY